MPGVVIDERAAVLTDWEQTDLYRFFARVFAPPSQECFAFMTQPSTVEVLRNLWQHLGCEGEFPEFIWFATRDLYESAYIALFDVGLPEPAVPLFESAHDKSHPAQEIALENTYFYDVLGLKADPTRGVPDYLVTQLEFLAAVTFTQDNASDKETGASLARAKSEFLGRHLLNWVPMAASKLKKTGAPGFPLLMDMLVQFLRGEYSGKSKTGSAIA
jgi:DMSO reductase family type II enzyme chaperone